MQQEHEFAPIVALYGTLGDTEAAHSALLASGLSEARLLLGALDAEQIAAAGLPDAVERAWSLTILPDDQPAEALIEELRRHRPLTIGRIDDPRAARDEVARGAIAWRHYVFESPVATESNTFAAGQTGMTGVANTGAFANDAIAEDDPIEGRRE